MNFLASAALRVIPGAFIVNSGLGKIGMPAEKSAGMQQWAAVGVPAVKNLPADKFGTILGSAETSLGLAMLAPFIPNRLVGAGLTAFSSGLLTLYFGDPDNRKEDGLRPSDKGLVLAKDSWLFAIGLALVFGSFGAKKA